jgi:hypothetical protein
MFPFPGQCCGEDGALTTRRLPSHAAVLFLMEPAATGVRVRKTAKSPSCNGQLGTAQKTADTRVTWTSRAVRRSEISGTPAAFRVQADRFDHEVEFVGAVDLARTVGSLKPVLLVGKSDRVLPARYLPLSPNRTYVEPSRKLPGTRSPFPSTLSLFINSGSNGPRPSWVTTPNSSICASN